MGYVNEGSVLAVGVLFIILGTISVVVRLLIQHRKSRLGADDGFAVAAWLFLMGMSVLMIIGSATHGIGGHSPPGMGPGILDYDTPEQAQSRKLQYSFDIISICALGCLKLSVLLFYRRLFSTASTAAKLTNSILLCIVAAWTVAFTIGSISECGSNFSSRFGPLKGLREKCIDTFAFLIALAATDVAVDIIILVIPVLMISPLRMPLKKRLSVIAILMLGMSATACGIARMSLFVVILGPHLLSKPTVAGIPSDDSTGIASALIFWGMLEAGIASIAINLPVIYSLFRKWSAREVFGYFNSLVSFVSVPGGTKDSVEEMKNMEHRRNRTPSHDSHSNC